MAADASPRASDPAPLLPLVAAGGSRAMHACIDRYAGLVWSLARRLLPRDVDAEDAVQEVFVELWQHAGRYRPEQGAEPAFVAMIARRRLIDRLRNETRGRRRLEAAAQERPAEHVEPAGGDDAVHEEIARVRDALDRLSDGQRTVLELALHHDRTHEQIARQTGLPLGTVKTHARRGLLRLRALLSPADADPGAPS